MTVQPREHPCSPQKATRGAEPRTGLGGLGTSIKPHPLLPFLPPMIASPVSIPEDPGTLMVGNLTHTFHDGYPRGSTEMQSLQGGGRSKSTEPRLENLKLNPIHNMRSGRLITGRQDGGGGSLRRNSTCRNLDAGPTNRDEGKHVTFADGTQMPHGLELGYSDGYLSDGKW
eukprot:CAMPEP_0197854330 /NCGR_PEP_ID=MMETSP1438-20131217/24481_1 /TAXON_ID=1461541 /ORGANISM="Pterosperma sp., Strain CCMP1384" /LENGTH=170 /DNA_ID=CAMNT_0043469033 /DNA_START=320 /DNA_END=829 /DNA_ORIENTATION=-